MGTKIEARDDSNSAQGRIMANGFIARDNYGSATNITNGMYSPGSNTLAFATNSSEALRIDSSGKVGIGTASPFRVFEINNSQPCIRLTNGTNAYDIGTGGFVDGSDSLCIHDQGQGERLRIDSSGRVLIGTTTNTFTSVGSSRLQVSGTGADTAGIKPNKDK